MYIFADVNTSFHNQHMDTSKACKWIPWKSIWHCYSPSLKLPDVSMYAIVRNDSYSGPPWNQHDPNNISTILVSLGSWRQISLTMAWPITIHKSQGLMLQKAMIDIDKIEKWWQTFIAIFRVKSLNNFHIPLTFSFRRYSKINKNPMQ